ncbi:MAG: phosphoribosylformylglycinamidine synthase subunit PurS [Candidatus Bathyarchaeota archaeon]|nr:phosphoribosylformylglycinamidine synthase subunit PurS [Candidatus Bathyarchaeota archaeon]
MKYLAKIEVSLKPGHTDPEGNTTQHLLRELGYSVDAVNVSKAYSIQLEADGLREAKVKAEEMAKRLLANPTKDNYTISVEMQK